MIAPARIAAFRALRAVTDHSTDLPDALHRVRSGLPGRQDRALVNEIVTGTLRWRAALDHLIVHFTDRPLSRLDPIVRDVLRMSTYQLLHLDRVPHFAVVHDAVDITRTAGRRHSASLTNAALRALLRSQPNLPLPGPPPPIEVAAASERDFSTWPKKLQLDAMRFLSITQSHPKWLVERWLHRYGYSATLAWTDFNNTPARLTLRVNTLRTSREELSAQFRDRGVMVESARYARDGLTVTAGNQFLPDLNASDSFLVQDEASQLVSQVVQAEPGQRVLDACAAPGGKTVALAADMANTGLLIAADSKHRRLSVLANTVSRARARVVRLVAHDLLLGTPFGANFDRTLVDAPCTGLGTVRRDPDIRWRRRPDDLQRLANRQLKMLRSAARSVRRGGRLVYATCSSEPEENERVVEAFLENEPAFRAEDLRETGDNSNLRSIVNPAGYLRSYPHAHGLDAFFTAAFIRR